MGKEVNVYREEMMVVMVVVVLLLVCVLFLPD